MHGLSPVPVPLLPMVLVRNISSVLCSVNKWMKINVCSYRIFELRYLSLLILYFIHYFGKGMRAAPGVHLRWGGEL